MKIRRIKILLSSSLLLMVLCFNAIAQTPAVTREAFQSEIDKVIAEYPHGAELYRVSDNFERLMRAKVANKLGLTNTLLSFNGKPKNSTLSISTPADLTPDIDDEDEASIAISRIYPNIIVAGANDQPGMFSGSMPAYVSTDAGQNWSTYRLPALPFLPDENDSVIQAFGDPMLICDDSGIFYYSFLISSQLTSTSYLGWVSDLMVARSLDGGKNWTLGSTVLGNSLPALSSEDKETIAVDRDPASPYYGRLYIVWTHFADYYELIAEHFISYSTNRGVSWSTPDTIPTEYGYFPLLKVGKGGDVFIASSYRDSVTYEGTYHTMMVSHDGGKTFSENMISSYTNYPRNYNYPNEIKDSVKSFPYVNFDVDPSNNKLYAVYGTYDSSCDCAAQYAVTSTDEGASWSERQQIGTPDLLSTDHFQPWVTFDPATGKAGIVMYSSEDDTTNNLLTRMVFFNFDAPTIPQALGTDLFDPNQVIGIERNDPFIGDYTGADAYDGVFAAAWTEKNSTETDGDIFAYVAFSPIPPKLTKINKPDIVLQDPSPNPVYANSISFVATSNVSSRAILTLYDLNSRAVVSTYLDLTPSGESAVTLDIHNLSSGVYFAFLDADGFKVEKDIIVFH